MVDERQTREIRQTIRRVKSYWYRSGIPRRVRRDKAEELRDHLLEAVANGRRVEEVVGRDVAAFASEWAQAERPRPLLDVCLQFVAALTLVPGGFALLNPWLSMALGQRDPRTGLPVGSLTFLAVFVPAMTGWQLIRVLRHRFTTQQTAVLGVLLFIVYAVALFFASGWRRDTGTFVEVQPTTAWTLVIIGTALQGLAAWIKRRGPR